MNERIRELIKQASYNIIETDGAPIISREFDKEKFAELLIQDCITQIALIGISNFQNDDIMWTTERSIEMIKKQFGIKE